MQLDEMILDLQQNVEIKAAIGEVYRQTLYRLGEGNMNAEGQPMQMVLEPWAGGRWFRDRGNGVTHLWGHVQVVKAPVLLELSGPMFMSYPVINHIELKLEEIAGGTKLSLRHRAFGFIDPEHRKGVHGGWANILKQIANDAVARTVASV